MPGQRRTVGSRSRRSWLPVLAGLGAIVVVVGAGVVAYVLAFHPARQPHGPGLTDKVASYLTVGLISQAAQPNGSGTELLQLLNPQGLPSFAQVGLEEEASGQPEWNADLMSDGSYIFIYVPTGQCLAATGKARRPQLAVEHCNLGLGERWRRLSGAVTSNDHQFFEFESSSTGKCIAQVNLPEIQPDRAGLASCNPSHPASELIAFWWTAQQ